MDPIDPAYLRGAYWSIYEQLDAKGHLTAYEGVVGTRLVSLDGSQYFSSQKIHCAQCKKTVKDEQVSYSHGLLLAVLSAPEQEQVICLEPEFLTPQDGHKKQDCEQQAIKRWVKRKAERFEAGKVMYCFRWKWNSASTEIV